MATNVAARIAPSVVNGGRDPEPVVEDCPTIPRRPNARNSATPPTTGGTHHRQDHDRPPRSARPGNSIRASTHASGIPKTVANTVAPMERTSDTPEHVARSRVAATCSSRCSTPASPTRPKAATSASSPDFAPGQFVTGYDFISKDRFPARPERPRHPRCRHDRRDDQQRHRADRPRLRRQADADPRPRPLWTGARQRDRQGHPLRRRA